MNRTTMLQAMTSCLALLFTAFPCSFAALSFAQTPRQPAKIVPETPQQQPPPNNWITVSSPGVTALAKPDSFLQYGPPPDGLCCPGNKHGSCIHRLIEWATYYPKYRVGCSPCCNSCQYKGVLPIYLMVPIRPCVCGSGLHATFANQCYKGCNSCAAGATGHGQ